MKIFFLFIISSKFNIYEDLTFDQFKEKFKIFTENSSYPDIKD